MALPNKCELLLNKYGTMTYKSSFLDDTVKEIEPNTNKIYKIEQEKNIRPFILNPSEYSSARKYSKFLSHPSSNTVLIKLDENHIDKKIVLNE